MTLNFDLLTYKWNHASPVSWASLLSIFILLSPSVFDLDSGTGQTDRRTDNGHHCIVPPHYGGGSITNNNRSSSSSTENG